MSHDLQTRAPPQAVAGLAQCRVAAFLSQCRRGDQLRPGGVRTTSRRRDARQFVARPPFAAAVAQMQPDGERLLEAQCRAINLSGVPLERAECAQRVRAQYIESLAAIVLQRFAEGAV